MFKPLPDPERPTAADLRAGLDFVLVVNGSPTAAFFDARTASAAATLWSREHDAETIVVWEIRPDAPPRCHRLSDH